MTQLTSLGEAELVTYIKVEKADGTVRYLRVQGETTAEITAAEYEEAMA